MGGWITEVIAVPTKSGDEVVVNSNSSRTRTNPERDYNDASHITPMIKYVSRLSSFQEVVVQIKRRSSANINSVRSVKLVSASSCIHH